MLNQYFLCILVILCPKPLYHLGLCRPLQWRRQHFCPPYVMNFFPAPKQQVFDIRYNPQFKLVRNSYFYDHYVSSSIYFPLNVGCVPIPCGYFLSIPADVSTLVTKYPRIQDDLIFFSHRYWFF